MEKGNSTIFKKAVKESKYAQIDNDLINNKELSFKALGIMAYILSKPDDWQVYISDLRRDKDGEKSVRSGLNELKEKKYIQRYQVYDMDTGKIHHWETLVSECPFADSDLISSVKEKYLRDEDGNIMTQKISIKNFTRYIPIVLEREVTLLSQKGEIDNKADKTLLSQKVKVETLNLADEGQQILYNTNTKYNTNTNSKSKGSEPSLADKVQEILDKPLSRLHYNKVIAFERNYGYDFVNAVIDYAAESKAQTFAWIDKSIDSFIADGITTADAVKQYIEEYREKAKERKNKAIKEKELNAAIEVAKERELDDMIQVDTADAKESQEIKATIVANLTAAIGAISCKTWIETSDFLENDKAIIMCCPNEFTKDIIENRYYKNIADVLRICGINKRLELVTK